MSTATNYMASNRELRAEVKRLNAEGRSFETMAEMCGWMRRDRNRMVGDTSRLRRRIGLHPEPGGRLSVHIRSDVAEHICRSLGLDPIDCGI